MINIYWKNLKYILIHKYYVLKASIKLGILWRGLLHDLSKFLPDEFIPYAKFFYGDGQEKRIEIVVNETNTPFDKAWLMHQHRNLHHWQSWLLKEDSGKLVPLDIPEKYIREMVADWWGAGKARKNGKDVRTWWNDNKDKIVLSNYTYEKVRELIWELEFKTGARK